jgi:hypothetical protein
MAKSWSSANVTVMSARPAPALRAPSYGTPRQHPSRHGASAQDWHDGGIIDYLKNHPQSTAGDVAKALNANRNTTATRLSQMVKKGQITKASKGYAVK